MKILCTGGSGFIGTHLMDQFLANKNELLNVDIKAPQKADQFKYWMECDILDFEKLLLVFAEFQPTHVENPHPTERTATLGVPRLA